jgi:hypothetical protein
VSLKDIEPFQWQPGQSGNPGGKPKGTVGLMPLIRKLLNEGDGKEAEKVARAALKKAQEGDAKVLAMFLDRLDGPIAARVIVESELAHMLAVAKDVLPEEHYAALVAALAAAPSPG